MKKGLKLLLSAAFALSIAGCANGSSNDDKTIKIGATAIPHAEILNDVVKDELEKEGYTLEVTEFTDYVTPNTSLEDGDLDANYFQTLAYLKEQNKERKLHLKAVAGIHYEAMALYSENLKSLDDLKDGATIAVPNDGSNESRALALLAKKNLIELNDDTLYTTSSITSNPHNYKIEELEAANLSNNLPDVDVAVINGNYALEHNLGDSANVLLTESFTDEEIEQALVEFDYKIQSYKNDDIIVSSGKIHKYSAFVLEGAAQIQKYNSDGVREILGRVYSDSIGWLITAAPRTTHCDIEIVSHGESTILFLDFAKIKENDYKKIIIQQKLLKNLFVLFEEMDLRSLEYKIVLSERSIRKKIMRYFEFREKRDGSSSFCIEGSRQDFADYLSVDKSALSRELNKMKKDGLIDFNGDNFTILQKL